MISNRSRGRITPMNAGVCDFGRIPAALGVNCKAWTATLPTESHRSKSKVKPPSLSANIAAILKIVFKKLGSSDDD